VFSKDRLIVGCAVGLSLVASALCSGASAAAPADPPAARPMSELKITATIPIAKHTDWVRITPTSVWVGSKGPFAVNEIDPKTNKVVSVPLPGDPCAGLAADADHLWVPLCGPSPKLAKVDLKTRTLSAVFDVGPGAKEGGIAVGAGSVWMMVDTQGALARIDPATGAIVGKVQLPPGSYNPVFSEGRVWVTRADGSELTVVDAKTAKVVDHVAIGSHPRFLTAGAGAVWTLNQGDGSLSRIDVAGRRPVDTVQLRTPGPGGDIAYADGRVWTTMMKTPLTAVDAARSVILCQWKGAGGDAVGVGHGAVWLTDLSAGTVLRIALSDLPKECRAAHGS
jgi:YVTN family beta-propeller protein